MELLEGLILDEIIRLEYLMELMDGIIRLE